MAVLKGLSRSYNQEKHSNQLKLDKLLTSYSLSAVLTAIRSRREVPYELHQLFLEAIKYIEDWRLDPLKVMISYAVIHEKLFD